MEQNIVAAEARDILSRFDTLGFVLEVLLGLSLISCSAMTAGCEEITRLSLVLK